MLLALLLFLLSLACHTAYAFEVALPDLESVRQSIADGDIAGARAALPNEPDDSPMLRLRYDDGIAFGVPFLLVKGQLAYPDNLIESLLYLEHALGSLAWCVPPTNAADVAAYNQRYVELESDICLHLARAARVLGKNYYAEYYGQRVLALPHGDEDRNIAATLELAQLYRNQGRYSLAYSVCTALYARTEFVPKDVFAIYAESAFRIGYNREAFSTLLTILYTDGVQAEKPYQDPALTLFLQRIGRAGREEILALYDALQTQLTLEELVRGKEDLIAFLINQRLLLAKIFPYLAEQTEEDLQALETRLRMEENLWHAHTRAHEQLSEEETTE